MFSWLFFLVSAPEYEVQEVLENPGLTKIPFSYLCAVTDGMQSKSNVSGAYEFISVHAILLHICYNQVAHDVASESLT